MGRARRSPQIAVGVIAWRMWQRQRTDQLKEKFGPEYDRTVAEADERGTAEKELIEREKRHETLDIRPLPVASRDRFQDEWQAFRPGSWTIPWLPCARPTGSSCE